MYGSSGRALALQVSGPLLKPQSYQKTVIILNMYLSNYRASKYPKEKLEFFKRKLNESTTKTTDFSSRLPVSHRISRQKISRRLNNQRRLNNTNQLGLTFIEFCNRQQ
jgi:hypothetical protein